MSPHDNRYEYYEKVENGDMNWMTSKFIAFASPQDGMSPTCNMPMQSRYYASSPQSPTASRMSITFSNIVRYFKEHDVTDVVRLNNAIYDKQRFTEVGIQHHEMYFHDGSTPPENILLKFFELCEKRTEGM